MIKGYTPSAHLLHERMDRLTNIAESIGFGSPIYFAPHEKLDDRSVIITDTGVVLIVQPVKKVIITMYVGQMEKIFAVTKGALSKAQYNSIKKTIKIYNDRYGI